MCNYERLPKTCCLSMIIIAIDVRGEVSAWRSVFAVGSGFSLTVCGVRMDAERHDVTFWFYSRFQRLTS